METVITPMASPEKVEEVFAKWVLVDYQQLYHRALMVGQGKNRRLRPVCVNLNILFILAPLVFRLFNLLHPFVRVYLNFSFLNFNFKYMR